MRRETLKSKEKITETTAEKEIVSLPRDLAALPPSEWMTDGVRLNNSSAPTGRIALIVVHGMGQQSHFDTMSGAADGLRAALAELRQEDGSAPDVCFEGPGHAQAGFIGDERVEFVAYAHVEYWKNARIYGFVLEEIGEYLKERAGLRRVGE